MAKFVRYELNGEVAHGALDGDRVTRLAGDIFDAPEAVGEPVALDRVRLLAPLAAPRIFGIGFNYTSHIRERNKPDPEFPVAFMKPLTAMVGPDDPIVYPGGSELVEYEGELAIVIGRPTRAVSPAEAKDAIFGITCANDVSERTYQYREMKMGALLMGKGFDTFCPLGPCIATGLDPDAVDLETRLNGEVRQRINTSDLFFSTGDLVAYLSRAITLLPGDVILTGTPSGIGALKPGDRVEVELAGVGVLSNPVVAEA